MENGAGTLVKILTPVSLCISVMALCVCVYVCASQDTNKPLPWVIPISPEGFEAMQPLTATPPKTVCGGWSWFSSLGSLAVRKVYTQVQAGTHTHIHTHTVTQCLFTGHTLFFLAFFPLLPHMYVHSLWTSWGPSACQGSIQTQLRLLHAAITTRWTRGKHIRAGFFLLFCIRLVRFRDLEVGQVGECGARVEQ